MSEAIKPTPGPWVEKSRDVYIGRKRVVHHTNAASATPLDMKSDFLQAEANAHLIAEAGTVHHETGLSPRQLVARVKELEEAAKLVLDWYEAENDHSKADFYQRMQMCRDSEDAIRAALSKALPNTVAEVK